jgi:cobalt-zinc-cadmium efflux system membrane fusion protein
MIRRLMAACAIAACASSGCRPAPQPDAKGSPPAKVDHPVKEVDLTTVTLTPEAERRLGVQVTPLAERAVASEELLAGEVIVPPDQTVEVTAPVAGTLVAAGGGAPQAGMNVRRGQALFRLMPLQPAERDVRIDAERDVATATAALDAARKRTARAEALLKDGSVSRRSVEEAQADLATAEATFKAAQERLTAVKRSPITRASEIIVTAPIEGLIQVVHAAPGQTVAASASLVEIARFTRLWVRVPVYAGTRDEWDASNGAEVLPLGAQPGDRGVEAQPAHAPPSADPAASAVHLIFELPPGRRRFQPGERVLVRLRGRAATRAAVVPESALLHDQHGNAWVYERTAPHVFVRRRVEVQRMVEGQALLTRGPRPGAAIVSTGAAELFGVEFGAGK